MRSAASSGPTWRPGRPPGARRFRATWTGTPTRKAVRFLLTRSVPSAGSPERSERHRYRRSPGKVGKRPGLSAWRGWCTPRTLIRPRSNGPQRRHRRVSEPPLHNRSGHLRRSAAWSPPLSGSVKSRLPPGAAPAQCSAGSGANAPARTVLHLHPQVDPVEQRDPTTCRDNGRLSDEHRCSPADRYGRAGTGLAASTSWNRAGKHATPSRLGDAGSHRPPAACVAFEHR